MPLLWGKECLVTFTSTLWQVGMHLSCDVIAHTVDNSEHPTYFDEEMSVVCFTNLACWNRSVGVHW